MLGIGVFKEPAYDERLVQCLAVILDSGHQTFGVDICVEIRRRLKCTLVFDGPRKCFSFL